MKMKHTLSIAVSAALMSMSAHSAQQFAKAASSFDYDPSLLQSVQPTSVNKNKSVRPILGNGIPKFVAEKGLEEKPYIYIVTLMDDSAVSYNGGVKGLAATTNNKTTSGGLTASVAQSTSRKFNTETTAVKAYVNYLDGQQTSFVNSAQKMVSSLDIIDTYKYAMNGVAIRVTPSEAEALSNLPGVKRIARQGTYTLETDVGPTLVGAPSLWDGSVTNSGVGALGAGIIIGTIDSGINTDSRSFTDIGDDGYDHTNPWGEGVYVGDCAEGFAELCNDKLIGIRSYDVITDVYADETVFPPGLAQNGEDFSGHGTHTAGTSGGNILIDVPVLTPGTGFESDGIETGFEFAQISGVAPHANVVAYQICYPGRASAGDTYADCVGSAIIAGIDDAIADGVDVINYSISGGGFPWGSATELAFLEARNAGIFVATSAGNSGPNAATTSKHAPWYTAVAASTHGRSIEYSKEIGDFVGGDFELGTLTGNSNTLGITASIVYAGDFENPNDPDGDPAQCLEPFPDNTFSGEIVLCDRGAIARVQKAANAAAGGAGGFVLGNVVAGTTDNDVYVIPGIHVDLDEANQLRAWLAAGEGHAATISASEGELILGQGDDLAGFSSRGPNSSISTITPHVAAPGVDIYAAYADQQFGIDGGIPAPSDFDFLSGTSMASPHVAGAAALLMSANPSWTPDNVRSALMMTATTNMRKEDGVTQADWFDMGSGRIQIDQANQTGLIMDETAANYEAANPNNGGDPKTLNLPSMANNDCLGGCSWTRTVTATKDGSWTASTTAITAGLELTVSPETFDLTAGESQVITVTASSEGDGESYSLGRLNLTSASSPDLHMPIAVIASSGNLPETVDVAADRNTGSFAVTDIETIALPELTLRSFGLTKATMTNDTIAQDTTPFSPLDTLDDVRVTSVTVPEGAKYFVAEITAAEAPDLDLLVAIDANGDGIPEVGEIIESRATVSSLENISIVNPTAGEYLVVVSSFASTGPEQLDAYTLATGVVDGEESDSLGVLAPASVEAASPFDIRLSWDIEAVEGDKFYGAFDVGSTSATPGDVGLVAVNLTKAQSDITIVGGSDALLEPGEQITYAVRVNQNLTDLDRDYEISVEIPEGVTLVEGSTTATVGDDGKLTWNIFQESILGKTPSYDVSTNLTDAFCGNPNFGQGSGYVDLAAFGIGIQDIDGDTVTGVFNSPVSFLGTLYPSFTATDDGFITVTGEEGSTPWVNQLMPDATEANGVIAPFWRDMIFDNANGSGISVATAGANFTIVEWDDMRPFAAAADDVIDFQMVSFNNPVGNQPNLVFSYTNVTNTSIDELGTSIGYEDVDGITGKTTHYVGAASDAIGDIAADTAAGSQLCFRLVNPDNTQFLTFTVEVDSENEGGVIELVAESIVTNSENPKTETSPANTDGTVSMVGDWDKDNDIDIDDVRGLIVAIQRRQEISMRFDLNDDGAVSYTDVRLLQQMCTRSRCAVE